MLALLRRELRLLKQDNWQLALISYIPLLGFLMLWWLFSSGLPRQLPVALVDQDNSSVSRMLSRSLDASPVNQVISYTNHADAVAAMRQGEVFAMVTLPNGLRRELLLGQQPQIDIRYTGQFLLVGKLLSSQISLALADGLQHLSRQSLLAHGVPAKLVTTHIAPVTTQTTALFNRNTNYVGFLVPPILVALWQLLAMLIFANALNRELTPSHWQQSYQIGWLKLIGAKLALYLPILLLHGQFMLALLYGYLGLPAAQLLWLLPVQLCLLLAVGLWVMTIFFLLADSARVISFSTALFAPAFAYMGITFPTSEMPTIAKLWRQLMPSSHYMEAQISLVSYGNVPLMWQHCAGMAGFLLLLIPALLLAYKRRPNPALMVTEVAP
ncbi:ABC transporter permease [Shewanella avicenniae]|uniref:ABC transporter permease n=1 Tax=Shewanella avicenniae TaxID=2814294 RepID=A0ABX7QP22_9GAMM|nr:ABC transporter permease [Shewanella avicenniae]QSX33224.1 ABC transporter permease [Shewanella avicenniae]